MGNFPVVVKLGARYKVETGPVFAVDIILWRLGFFSEPDTFLYDLHTMFRTQTRRE